MGPFGEKDGVKIKLIVIINNKSRAVEPRRVFQRFSITVLQTPLAYLWTFHGTAHWLKIAGLKILLVLAPDLKKSELINLGSASSMKSPYTFLDET